MTNMIFLCVKCKIHKYEQKYTNTQICKYKVLKRSPNFTLHSLITYLHITFTHYVYIDTYTLFLQIDGASNRSIERHFLQHFTIHILPLLRTV